MKQVYEFFIAAYKRGYFDRIENGYGIFELGQDDFYSFPILKPFSLVLVHTIETRTGENFLSIEIV